MMPGESAADTAGKRHRKVLRLSIAVIALAVIAVVITVRRRHVTRFYAFAGYSEGIARFFLMQEPVPDSLTEIERTYNGYDRRRVELPSPPYFLRPIYRPAGSYESGLFLTLIETKPGGLQDWTRYIVYSTPDGSHCRVDSVWEWELDDLIREDDALRAAAEKKTGI